MPLLRFNEVLGTEFSDSLSSNADTSIIFGLKSDDIISSQASTESTILFGGADNDTYTAALNTLTIIYDSSGSDTLNLPGFAINSDDDISVTTVNGTHLYAINENNGSEIFIFNWLGTTSKIETLNLADVSISADDLNILLPTLDISFGNITLDQAAIGLSNDLSSSLYSGADIEEAFSFYTDRENDLQNGIITPPPPPLPAKDGSPSADFFQGEVTGDIFFGRDGNDTLNGGGGNDTLNGNRGADKLFGGTGSDSIRGGKGDDFLQGNRDVDLLFGDLNNDTVRGGKGDDLVRGGKNNDFVAGDNDNDFVYGDKGDDVLHGGKKNDNVFGGEGNDIIYGDKGNDLLFGNEGADSFIFGIESGIDSIRDFEQGIDRIFFNPAVFSNSAEAAASFLNGIMDLGNGNLLGLYQITSVTEADFAIL